MGTLFTILIVAPITNLLIAIYQLFTLLKIPFALGFSIILLTVAIRFALYPLVAAQLRSSKKMQDIAPHLSSLREKYKGDPKRLQTETMLLYKQHGINPAAGCLPVLIQLPIIWGLYSVLQEAVKETSLSEINKLAYADFLKLSQVWDTNFFGIPLGQTPSQLLSTIGPGIFLVPLLTGVSQYIQSKMMLPAFSAATTKKKEKGADFATAFQTQSLYIFPVMIGFFSYGFPVGLSLYWITFTIFGIIQQYLMQKGQTPLGILVPREEKKGPAKQRKKK